MVKFLLLSILSLGLFQANGVGSLPHATPVALSGGDGVGGIDDTHVVAQAPIPVPLGNAVTISGATTLIFQTGPGGQVALIIVEHGEKNTVVAVLPYQQVSTWAPISEGSATVWQCWIFNGLWVGVRVA